MAAQGFHVATTTPGFGITVAAGPVTAIVSFATVIGLVLLVRAF
jgi:hypothetical protein